MKSVFPYIVNVGGLIIIAASQHPDLQLWLIEPEISP